MLTPTTPPGSTYRLLYKGPVGVVGVGVQQTLDLTILPKYIRQLKTFRDDWRVFVRQLDTDVSAFEEDIDFTADNSAMIFTLTSVNANAEVSIEAWILHSVIR